MRTVQQWEDPSQTSLPKTEAAIRLCELFGVTNISELFPVRSVVGPSDLVEVDVVTFDPTLNPSRVAESPAVYRDAPVMIAVYDVEAAAGEGFINDAEHVVAQVPFEKSELVKRGIAAKDVAALYVSGNSMRGSIDPGEIIFFVRQDDNRIVSDSVYIFRMGDAALVKRLEIRAPGKVTAKSDNADIEPFEINLKDQWLDFHIIGRVFASIKWH